MAMKYDAIIRAKINLRLEQLEEEIKKLQAEKMILLEEKASYYDKLIDTGLCLNLRDTSKELNIPERKFINFLLKKKYLYRNISGGLRPFSKYAKTELLY